MKLARIGNFRTECQRRGCNFLGIIGRRQKRRYPRRTAKSVSPAWRTFSRMQPQINSRHEIMGIQVPRVHAGSENSARAENLARRIPRKSENPPASPALYRVPLFSTLRPLSHDAHCCLFACAQRSATRGKIARSAVREEE